MVAAGLMEICLRAFGPPYYRFNNRSEEYYTNPRGYHDVIRQEGTHTVYGLTYHDSPEGYRRSLNDESLTLSFNQKTILGLGDSFTYGRGVRFEDIYLNRLEKLLNRGSEKYSIKNCGVVGANIDEINAIYELESAALPQGSFVIYGLVLNDFGLALDEPITGLNFIDINNGGYTFSPIRKNSALVNFIFHVVETRRLHTMTVNAYLESFEGHSAEHGFDGLKSLNNSIKEDDGILVVVIFPLLYDFENYRFRSIHEKIRHFCTRNQILCLDLFDAFSDCYAEDLWANPTDHHPNEIAHRIAADEIASFLERQHITQQLSAR